MYQRWRTEAILKIFERITKALCLDFYWDNKIRKTLYSNGYTYAITIFLKEKRFVCFQCESLFPTKAMNDYIPVGFYSVSILEWDETCFLSNLMLSSLFKFLPALLRLLLGPFAWTTLGPKWHSSGTVKLCPCESQWFQQWHFISCSHCMSTLGRWASSWCSLTLGPELMRHHQCKINSHYSGVGGTGDEELPIVFLNTSVYISLVKANHAAAGLLLISNRMGNWKKRRTGSWRTQLVTIVPVY